MGGNNGRIQEVDGEGGGAGETIEEGIGGLVELYGADLAAGHHAAAITADVALHAGDNLDAGAAVFQYHAGHDVFLGPIIDCLLLLLHAQAV